MPITQSLDGPGIVSAPSDDRSYLATSAYDDPVFKAVGAAYGADPTSSPFRFSDVFGANRVGALSSTGLSLESIAYGTNLAYSDPWKNAVSLGRSSSSALSGGGAASTGGVRTGSFAFNLIDLSGTLAEASGQTIGRTTPLMGTGSGSSDIFTTAMSWMNSFNTLPSHILDGIAFPVIGVQRMLGMAASPTAKRADGQDWYSFQSQKGYWDMVANADDNSLQSLAQQVASQHVGSDMQGAYAAQLFEVFKNDRNAATGLSSGSASVDYLAKKYLEADMWAGSDIAKRLIAGIGQGASTLVRDIPFLGGLLAEGIDPVKPETEAAWRALSPQQRIDLIGKNQTGDTLANLAWMLPTFEGFGVVMKMAGSGALGTALLRPVIGQTAGIAAADMGILGRVASEAGTMFGRVGGANMIRALDYSESALNIGGKAAYGVYDFGLRAMRVAMAAGLAADGARFAMEHAIPGFDLSIGKQVDDGAYVSSSPFAVALDNAGLFAGGFFGAKALKDITASTASLAAEKVVGASSPFLQLFEQHWGGSLVLSRLGKAIGVTDGSWDQSFTNMLTSHVSRYVEARDLEAVSRISGEDAQIAALREREQVREQHVQKLFTYVVEGLKTQRTWGVESDATLMARASHARVAREIMDDITRFTRNENGELFWQQELRRVNLEATPAGYKAYITKVAKEIGDINPDELKFGRDLNAWQQAANAIRHRYYDRMETVKRTFFDPQSTEPPLTEIEPTVVRQDHLSTDLHSAWKTLMEGRAAGLDVEAEIADLRHKILDGTPEGRDIWANPHDYRGTPGEARTSAIVSDDALTAILDEMAGSRLLMNYRAVTAEPGSFNDFHRRLAVGGVYDLAFPPSIESAMGTMKAEYEAGLKQIADWEARGEATKVAHEAAKDATYARISTDRVALTDEIVKPLQERQAADRAAFEAKAGPPPSSYSTPQSIETLTFRAKTTQTRFDKALAKLKAEYPGKYPVPEPVHPGSPIAEGLKGAPARRAAIDKYVVDLDAWRTGHIDWLNKRQIARKEFFYEWDPKSDFARWTEFETKQQKELVAAYERGRKQAESGAEYQRLKAEQDAAYQAREDWLNSDRPIAARVGPVVPTGFVSDPHNLDLFFAEKSRGSSRGFEPWELPEHIDMNVQNAALAGLAEPSDAFLHVTVSMSSVLKRGLLSAFKEGSGESELNRVLKANGEQPILGMKGGNMPGGISLSLSRVHTLNTLNRYHLLRSVAGGTKGITDILDFFRQFKPVANYKNLHAPGGVETFSGYDTPYKILDAFDELYRSSEYIDAAGNIIDPPRPKEQFTEWLGGTVKARERIDQARRSAVKGDLTPYEVLDSNGEFVGYADPTGKHIGNRQVIATTFSDFKKALNELEDGLNANGGEIHDPTSAEAWQKLADLLQERMDMHGKYEYMPRDPAMVKRYADEAGVDMSTPASRGAFLESLQRRKGLHDLFIALDSEHAALPGSMVYFMQTFDETMSWNPKDIGVVRVSVRQNPKIAELGPDFSEVRVLARDTFVHRAVTEQPFDKPVDDITHDWGDPKELRRPVSYAQVRNPDTGEVRTVQTAFNQYPMSRDLVNLGSRSWLAHKMDSVTRGFRSWKLSEAQYSQTMRLISSRYPDATPEQVGRFIRQVSQMAFEHWSPVKMGDHLQTPLQPQAVAILRAEEVQAIGARIFGSADMPGGRSVPTEMRRADGTMEVPNWAKLFADGHRQGWSLNFTAGLTSRLKSYNHPLAIAATLMVDWLVPYLRYAASPVFKTSELIESAQFNAMRGAARNAPEMRRMFEEFAGTRSHGQLRAEMSTDEMMKQLGAALLPTAEDVNAAGGLAGLGTGSHALWDSIDQELTRAAARPGISGRMRDAIEAIKNPTPFKDGMAADLTISNLGIDFAGQIRKFDPQAYDVLHKDLKVPDTEIVKFIVEDRALYQKWQDVKASDEAAGREAFAKLLDHTAKHDPSLKVALTDDFYKSEAYASTEMMLRIAARSAQTEAFGVHYFGSYRSSLERSLNHPVLGIYPASWAYKAAKEWVKFLYDNRMFGDGYLRLGAAPAAWIQQVTHAQDKWFAQNTDTTIDQFINKGPLGRWFFLANMLLPGDWSSIPFPASRSIRTALRGDLNPVDHMILNLFGPQNRGGIGVIRDMNMAVLGIGDIYNAMTSGGKASPWDNLYHGLNPDGTAIINPALYDSTKYPVNQLQRTLSVP